MLSTYRANLSDLEVLNSLARDPRVKKRGLLGEASFNFENILKEQRHVVMLHKSGKCAQIAVQLDNGLYEAHTLMGDASVRQMFEMARDNVFFMFTATDCFELLSKADVMDEGSIKLGRKFLNLEGFGSFAGRDMEFYRLTLIDFIRDNKELIKLGEEFHEKLGEAVSHEEDIRHNAWVGFVIACAKVNFGVKGVYWYNRFAGWFGYHPIQIVSTNPQIVKFDNKLCILDSKNDIKFVEV
jgi:hypothetical protein